MKNYEKFDFIQKHNINLIFKKYNIIKFNYIFNISRYLINKWYVISLKLNNFK